MTNFARTPARAARHHLVLLASAAVAAIAILCLAAGPARASIVTVGGEKLGLQPRSESIGAGEPESFTNEGGHAVLDGTSDYVLYWDPENVFFAHHEWLTNINHFFQDLGAASGDLATSLGMLGQYADRSGHAAYYKTVFKESWTDLSPYPAVPGCTDPKPLAIGAITCLTDAQLRAHLESFVSQHSLPKGMGSIFYIITPPGVTVCTDATATSCSDFSASAKEEEEEVAKSTSYKESFCSYHGAINPDKALLGDGNTILYAVIPWTAGTSGAGFIAAHGQLGGKYLYANGQQCQDGGWSFEGDELKREAPTKPSKEEEEILNEEKGTGKEREALIRKRRLEGPHDEEPNQEGKSESTGYAAGLSDLIDNQIYIQQADTVTDPLFDAWHDSTGHEVGNICQNAFGNVVKDETDPGIEGSSGADEHTEAGRVSNESLTEHRYFLQDLWSYGENSCSGGVYLIPRFTLPNPVNTGEVIGMTGLESSIGLLRKKNFNSAGEETAANYAKFTWNFGDGTEVTGFAPDAPPCESPWASPCAGSVAHTYTYGGEYEVTLTITDAIGDVNRISHTLKVDGPAPPAPPAATPPAPAPATTTGSSSASGAGGKSSGPPPVAPSAKAAIASRSLRKALRKGLAVSYSVNEQVAGHFEVLISKTLAHKLKIAGTPATGLPAGTAPQLVIAKAVIVTTKGGRSTVHIKFPKKVAARLKNAHNVPLMLRMVVRNASSASPQTSTVLSAITLAG